MTTTVNLSHTNVQIMSTNNRTKKISDIASSATSEETDIEEPAIPDSTTEKERPVFSVGEDALLKHKDGRYYLGTVVEIDVIREQCLLRFGDSTESWSAVKDLTKLSYPKETLMCVVCKKSAPKDHKEIIQCDKCRRGYHQKCHQPEIHSNYQKEGEVWLCKKCIDSQTGAKRSRDLMTDSLKSRRKESIRKLCSGVDSGFMPPTDRSKLPYDPDLLTWDTYHRVNMEQIYCYCGRNGEWYTQMLQCGRCRQWFHEKCVRCLRYPLYCGDRFYVFVCSICNYGKEFLRRLEMKWVDMVHLMLFNLTAFNAKKYYDLDTVIIPYINDNWHALQLPPKIHNVSKTERRDNVLSVLTNNRNRFKCGREIKKRTTIWGLRVRLPPPAPCITLPSVGPISEAELKERWHGNRRLQFLPDNLTTDVIVLKREERMVEVNGDKLKSNNISSAMVVPVDPVMLGLMMGTAYQTTVKSETESPCPSPDAEDKSSTDFNFKSSSVVIENEFEGGGFVKRSVPFPKVVISQRKKKVLVTSGGRDKILLRRQKRINNENSTHVRNQKYKKVRRLLKTSDKTRMCNKTDNLPLTPPTSVSGPPTPTTIGSTMQQSEISSDYTLNSDNLAQSLVKFDEIDTKLTESNLFRSNVEPTELNTPCDTSGDETSSKSTLDLIIPPPKNFEGKNNPFSNLPKEAVIQPKEKTVKRGVSLPLSLTPVIPLMRPLKRQLSEKDICIGPNGEVKRRRHRRTRSAMLHAQVAASKTATITPARPDTKILRSSVQPITNCVDYALNGRRLRQRIDKSQDSGKSLPARPQSNSAPTSPVTSETNISIDDLKSSVNIYFGAANRIASGEMFSVKAKRVGGDGKFQYLIEWEGHDQSVT